MRRHLGLVLTSLALLSCGASDSRPSELTAEQEGGVERADVVGEVLSSQLVHDSVGPVFSQGRVRLVDGTTLTIDDTTERVSGCDGVTIDSDDGTYVPDLRGCLAIVELNASGSIRTISLLDRASADLGVEGWILEGVPSAVGPHVIVFGRLALDYDRPRIGVAARNFSSKCVLMPMILVVDRNAHIKVFLGYGSAYLEDPCLYSI